MKEEIEKNLEHLEAQEHMILSEIDMLYKLNKQKLIEDAYNIIGLDY